jgi:hypothetical protein
MHILTLTAYKYKEVHFFNNISNRKVQVENPSTIRYIKLKSSRVQIRNKLIQMSSTTKENTKKKRNYVCS